MAKIKKEISAGAGKSVFYDCDICGKEQRKSKKHFLRSDKHFCSVECRDIYFSGKNTHTWNGGVCYKGGYKIINRELIEEKFWPMCDRRGYIKEHRYVMAKKLGRLLDENEIIHHIDNNKLNNDIDNLKLTNRSEHLKHHLKGKPNPYVRGENSKTAKLTKKQVLEIRRLLKETNLYLKDISKLFGVSISNISLIKRKETWKHI